MKLGILIPTIEERLPYLERLCTTLNVQIIEAGAQDIVKILVLSDNRERTTGAKRNSLISQAREMGCTDIAFFDDDDLPGHTYVINGIKYMQSGCDCASLIGNIYFSGVIGKPFLHSLKYTEWFEDHQYYYRMPNHLNFMKLSKIEGIEYPDQVFGEDGKFSYAVRDAGVLKTEFEITDVLYHYYVGHPKHQIYIK